MKLTSTLIFIVSLAVPGSILAQGPENQAKGLQVTLSAGILTAPTYLGDDDYQTSLFPNITLRYGNRFTASLRGIEFVAISHNGWQAGPVLSYDFGRNENPDDSPLALSADSNTDLVGLGDIDGTLELGGFLEFNARSFAAKLAVQQGIDGGNDGLSMEASVSYRRQLAILGRPTFFSIGPAVSFGDDAYNSTLFDISASQSAASGISQYDAGAGMNSIGLHTSAMMPLTKRASLVGLLKYDRHTGDAGNSSLVTERGSKDQVAAGLFVNYRF